MTSANLYLGFKPHRAQSEVNSHPARFKVMACGRRFGKTLNCLYDMSLVSLRDGLPVAYFAPDYKTMEEVWTLHKGFFQPITAKKDETLHRITLSNGVPVEYWTLENPNAGRSRAYGYINIDEAGQVANLLEIWNGSIRPTLTDYRGKATFQGTPRGRNGFWQFFQRGLDSNKEFPNWKSWQFPSSVNPYLDPRELEEAKHDMPERLYRQEYLAEFLSDEEAVFRYVEEAATATEHYMPIPGHTYVFGVDYARTFDFSVICVYDATTQSEVLLDKSRDIPFAMQCGRLRALYERYQPIAIHIEDNAAGMPIIEFLYQEGLPVVAFHTSNPTKSLIVDTLALGFERRAVRILPDQHHIGELQAYEATRTGTGLFKYGAPEGFHDDTVMALMLAYYAAQSQVMGEASYYDFSKVFLR
jgi:hypothetical protein